MTPGGFQSDSAVRGRWQNLTVLLVLFISACRSAPRPKSAEEAPPASTNDVAVASDLERPSPVLPEEALFVGQYGNLELTITAARDGSVKKVTVSKPSRVGFYDEYTRKWVETHWKMPLAGPSDPEVRKFIAPIVYPRGEKPAGGHFPPPTYPYFYERDRVQGLVIVDIKVSPAGEIESARTVLSSGYKGMDDYTVDWVRKRWQFPPGKKRWYHVPVAYVLTWSPVPHG